MAMFMSLIGAQILSSVRAAGAIERRQTAVLLTESLIGRLQSGGFELTDQTQQVSDTFGDAHPGWGWQVFAEPTEDDQTLIRVRLRVLRDETGEGDVTVDSMTPVTEMTTFWAMPVKFNLVEDFGMSEEDAGALAAAGIDPYSLDPAALMGMDLGDLLRQFPQLEGLLRMYGLDVSMLSAMDPEMIRSALEGVLGDMGGSGGGSGGGAGDGGGADGGDDGGGSGSIDFNEVRRLLESGDQQAAEDYIRSHAGDELGGGAAGGR